MSRHVPIRTCIATGVKKPKSDMVRVVRLEDVENPQNFIVKIDAKGKERGRGASIDNSIEAFDLAIKKKAIERALKLERNLTEEEIERLRNEFNEVLEGREFREGNKPVTLKVTRAELAQKLGK